LPAPPNGIALASGIAFVADGLAGLQIVNYLPFDTQGKAPTIKNNLQSADIDPNQPGIQVYEGSKLTIQSDIRDDVQVANAQLLVNGQPATTAVSAPFDFSIVAPSGANSVTLQIQTTDTGGNRTLSDPLVIGIEKNANPPVLVPSEAAQHDRIVELPWLEFLFG